MLITNKPSTNSYKNNNLSFGFKISPVIPYVKASEGHLNLQRTFDGKVCGLVFTNFIDPFKNSLRTIKEIKLPSSMLKLLNAFIKPPKKLDGKRYF